METKSKLQNLFRNVASDAGETHNVIKKISEIARKHFPTEFSSVTTNNSLADELETPLNILIPAYETMWRVVLYAILEIKVRPLLNKDYGITELDLKEIDNAVKTFLKKPNHSTLKKDSFILWCIIQETLRLYPPTRNIHRVDDKNNTVTIEVEKIHRDPENWGEDATFFKPKRFLSNKMNKAHIPFSHGKLKCVAADKFAPTFSAILISAILDRVDDVILGQKTKESLSLKANLPFENNRYAFDNIEVTLIKKSRKKENLL
ncbi:cytochrome P450 [Rhizophagus clarus]|nr:cytochrome P450 [Rhizophagus clarus]